jgi:hypothetical protein
MPLAITFYDVVLTVHIAAVVVAFGVTFTYPLLFSLARRHPRHLPFAYRFEHAVTQRVLNPGLLVVLLAGVYLASKGHDWSEFWVQWAFGAVIVIGAIAGSVLAPAERKLIEIADRAVAAAPPGDGEITFGAEHDALVTRLQVAGTAASLLVLVTIFVMTAKPFA